MYQGFLHVVLMFLLGSFLSLDLSALNCNSIAILLLGGLVLLCMSSEDLSALSCTSTFLSGGLVFPFTTPEDEAMVGVSKGKRIISLSKDHDQTLP